MTVNHASTLSPKYFEAYFRLVLISREFNLNDAKAFIEETFFKGDCTIYGSNTYKNFLTAFKNLDALKCCVLN